MEKNASFLGVSLLMIVGYYTYSYSNDECTSFGYSDENNTNENLKKFNIPNRKDISVFGPIDSLLVNEAYYEGVLNGRIHVFFEDEHTIRSTLSYVPFSLLDDITEKNAFNAMYDQVNDIWQQPSEETYLNALTSLRNSNNQFIKEYVIEEMQEETFMRSSILFDLLEKTYQLSDIDFVDQLLDLVSGIQMQKNIYKDKVMGGIFDSVDPASKDVIVKTILDTVSTLRALETTPCLTTVTFVSNAINIIKIMDIQPAHLMGQVRGEVENLGDMACLFMNENAKAVESVTMTILLKLVRGLLAKSLGTTFEQYHAKRVQEVDYLILEKLADIGLTKEELQVAPGSVRVDEKTVCTVELSENGITGESICLIVCTTRI